MTESSLVSVSRETGLTEIYNSTGQLRTQVDTSAGLISGDSIQTAADGLARIQFITGSELRIFENSLVNFEEVQGPESEEFVLTLQKGKIEALNLDSQTEIWIQKNGERLKAAEYNDSALALSVPESVKSVDDMPKGEISSNLNLDDLQKILSEQEPQFYRCYTQLIQKAPESKGQAILQFTVEPTGKIKNVDVISKTLNEPSFKACLEEVLNRLKIRPFQGAEIATAFPLSFE